MTCTHAHICINVWAQRSISRTKIKTITSFWVSYIQLSFKELKFSKEQLNYWSTKPPAPLYSRVKWLSFYVSTVKGKVSVGIFRTHFSIYSNCWVQTKCYHHIWTENTVEQRNECTPTFSPASKVPAQESNWISAFLNLNRLKHTLSLPNHLLLPCPLTAVTVSLCHCFTSSARHTKAHDHSPARKAFPCSRAFWACSQHLFVLMPFIWSSFKCSTDYTKHRTAGITKNPSANYTTLYSKEKPWQS